MTGLKAPCKGCPFRIDGHTVWVRPGRILEIGRAVLGDGDFICHKTTHGLAEGDTYGPETRFCAGAAILLIKVKGTPYANMATRLRWIAGERLDVEALTRWDAEHPGLVPDTLTHLVEAHQAEHDRRNP